MVRGAHRTGRSGRCAPLVCLGLLTGACAAPEATRAAELPLLERVEHHYAETNDVRIHYVTLGDPEAPPLVLLHGFPDYWYSWREQMPALAEDFHVAAVDLRGYNLSDQPEGVGKYAFPYLIADVASVIRDLGHERAVIVGHDWGGAIAWSVAMFRPDLVERLIVLNLPHPRGMTRELAKGGEQHANSQYARDFQAPDAHESLTAEGLAGWVQDPEARAHYVEAFERSDFEAMLNYYKANFPSTPSAAGSGVSGAAAASSSMPIVKAPVLMIHGLEDQYLLAAGLNDTWEWLEQDLTIVTIPGAGHFVQQDAAELVTRSMLAWLHR